MCVWEQGKRKFFFSYASLDHSSALVIISGNIANNYVQIFFCSKIIDPSYKLEDNLMIISNKLN